MISTPMPCSGKAYTNRFDREIQQLFKKRDSNLKKVDWLPTTLNEKSTGDGGRGQVGVARESSVHTIQHVGSSEGRRLSRWTMLGI